MQLKAKEVLPAEERWDPCSALWAIQVVKNIKSLVAEEGCPLSHKHCIFVPFPEVIFWVHTLHLQKRSRGHISSWRAEPFCLYLDISLSSATELMYAMMNRTFHREKQIIESYNALQWRDCLNTAICLHFRVLNLQFHSRNCIDGICNSTSFLILDSLKVRLA